MISETDAAWMAGLFEGEGCIDYVRTGSVRLQLRMTDKDVVDAWKNRAGYGNVCIYKDPRPNAKTVYYWTTSKRSEVERILNAILPWMGERRKAKIQEALIRVQKVKYTNH